ncbi:MAG: hypothetical protein HYX78_04180 [Armatimonadetes bacterium]|nr:hypothetical protein [Armatimonadota bacterium]
MHRLVVMALSVLLAFAAVAAVAQEKSDFSLGADVDIPPEEISSDVQHYQEWGYVVDPNERATCIAYFALGNTRFTKAPIFTGTWTGNHLGWSTYISSDRKAVYLFGPRTHFGPDLGQQYGISYIVYYDDSSTSQDTVIWDGSVQTFSWSRTGTTGDGYSGSWGFDPNPLGGPYSPLATSWLEIIFSGIVNSPGPGAYVGEPMQVGPMSAVGVIDQPGWPWGVIESYAVSETLPPVLTDLDQYGWGMYGTIDYLDIDGRTHVSEGSWWIYYTPVTSFPIEQGTYLIKTSWTDGWENPATVTGKFWAEPGSTVQSPPWPVDYVDWSSVGVASFAGTFTNPNVLDGTLSASDNKLVLNDVGGEEILFVKYGQPIDLELWQRHMSTPSAGYQAFLSFDPTKLNFGGGSYTTAPYGLSILGINANGGNIDLAAGIDPGILQPPYAADAKLADLQFTSGISEGITQVTFRESYPPSRFTDDQGYPLVTQTVDGPIVIIDNTPPAGLTVSADPASWTKDGPVILTFSADDALSGISHYVLIMDGVDNYEVTSPYSLDISEIGTGIYPVTIRAFDRAGNYSSATVDIYIDQTPPVLTLPLDQTVYALPNSCSANVDVGVATAVDNVDPSPTVTAVRSDGMALSDPYTGVTQITWTARDAVGNESTGVQTITVLSYNEAVITVQLEGVYESPVRPIQFVFGGTQGSGSQFVTTENVQFDSNGVGTVTVQTLPCGNLWTQVTAKDSQHTLRSKVSLSVALDGSRYEASLTGADKLTGGDLTDDNVIDIRDYGVFAGQYGTSGHPFTGRDADISCDGQVWAEDFTFIQINFMKVGAPLPGYAEGASTSDPIALSTISVKELAGLIGMRDARKADVNNDGIVDAADMSAFLDKYRKPKR